MGRLINKINTCVQCASTFHPWHNTPDARFCSKQCHYESGRVRRKCEICQTTFVVDRNHDERLGARFCSRKCKGVRSKYRLLGDSAPWYKGGWVNQNGYRVISIDSKKYLEHRYVVEQSIGRPLRKDETVHHINGNKLDNRISNLRLMSYPEHTLLHWKLKRGD